MDYVHTYCRLATSLVVDGSLFSSAIHGSWRNGLSGEREPSMVPSRESVIHPLVRHLVHNRPLQRSTYFRKLAKVDTINDQIVRCSGIEGLGKPADADLVIASRNIYQPVASS